MVVAESGPLLCQEEILSRRELELEHAGSLVFTCWIAFRISNYNATRDGIRKRRG
jgi:hypothetical protein